MTTVSFTAPVGGHRSPWSEVRAIINGERCEVIDLSVTGAQVVLPTRLRPDQPLRITLFDRDVQTQCRGVVAWSIAEPTRGAVRYRALEGSGVAVLRTLR